MMENNNTTPGSMFGGLGGMAQPRSNLQGLSPYLNIDTNYLQSTPEYVFDEETKRGLMEKSFTAIGTSVCVGAGFGAAHGLYKGHRELANSDLTGKIRRTQLLNHLGKGASSSSNAIGSVAVIYSLTHALLTKTVYEQDDELKSILCGTFTGAFFKSTAGIRKCAMSAGYGMGLAAIWAFYIKKQEEIQNYL